MPRRILIILRGFRGKNHAKQYKRYYSLPQGFTIALVLQADALKFDFKLTNKKNTVFNKVFLGKFSMATGKKDALQQKF